MGRFEAINDGARWALGKTYVESGAVEYALAPLDDLSQQEPGILHRAATDVQPPEKPNWQPMPDDGQPSIAFGMKELLKETPFAPKLESQQNAVFLKVLASSVIPPSLFSGKMQLWIQAMYGGRPEKWRLQLVKEDNAVPYLILKRPDGHDRALYFDYGRTCGLVTNPETLDYYIVAIGPAQVQYSRLELSSFAESLAAYVLALDNPPSAADMARWEAYLLADARIDPVIYSAEFGALVGEPIGGYHGWSFDWQGARARIVTHQPFISGGTYHRRARTYQMAFGFDVAATRLNGRPPLTVALTVLETAEYQIRPGSDLLWYYDYIINLMVTVTTPLNVAGPYGDAPMHGFFDAAGEWIETRYSYTATTLPAIYLGPVDKPQLCAESDGPAVHEYEGWGGSALVVGFANARKNAKITTSGSYRHTAHSLSITARGAEPTAPVYTGYNYASTLATAPPGNYCTVWGSLDHQDVGLHFAFQTGDARYLETDEYSSGVEAKTLLLLPQNDVAAVYLGTLSHRLMASYSVLDNTIHTDVNLWAFQHGAIGDKGALIGGQYVRIDSSQAAFYDPPATAIYNADRYEIKISYVDRSDEATEVADKTGTSYFDDVGIYASFFYPPLNVDPTNSTIYRSNHGLHDDCTFTGDVSDEAQQYRAKGDYDYFPSYSYVGWA